MSAPVVARIPIVLQWSPSGRAADVLKPLNAAHGFSGRVDDQPSAACVEATHRAMAGRRIDAVAVLHEDGRYTFELTGGAT
jgi:hypothetical protein